MRVIYETARWVNSHHAESAPTLAKYRKLDPERISEITRVSFGTSLEPGLLQPVLDVAYRCKQLEKPVSAVDLIAHL